jgi:hypothetical protein
MALRIDTVLTEFLSAEFSPTDTTTIQVQSAIPVIVDVEVKLDAAANYAGAYSIRSDSEPISRFAYAPFMRLRLRGNAAGNAVKVWDSLG